MNTCVRAERLNASRSADGTMLSLTADGVRQDVIRGKEGALKECRKVRVVADKGGGYTPSEPISDDAGVNSSPNDTVEF